MATPMTQPIPSPAGPCTPAAPPSRSEVERKLSFRSAASPRIDQSPRKKRSPSTASGNESDTSLSSAQGLSQSASLASPILSPSLSVGGGSGGSSIPAPNLASRQLSAIAERLRGNESVVEEVEEYEEHDEGEDVSDEEDQGEAEQKGQGELERGMEGERVLRAGYLYKKQEKRKVWKKKWFVLRTGKLAYYKDDREYSLSRVMDLRIIHTAAPVKVKKHSFTFGIVTKKRTFLVEASSQSEMDEWVAAISNARRKLTEDGEKRAAGPTPRQPSGQAPEGTEGYSSSAAGTSPVVNTSYLARNVGTPINSSPAQMYPSSGLPSAYASSPPSSEPSQPGLISQMARVNVSSTQSQPVGAMRSPSAPTAPGQPVRSFSRREPSASSLSSAGADYFPKTPSAGQSPNPPPAVPVGQGISSDSDDLDGGEGDMYFSDIASRSQLGTSVGTTKTGFSLSAGTSVGGSGFMAAGGGGQVDPSRVILSAYLMKRSKGRGRKVWRKRWFYLTSQGLTYTKSHMDTKPLRNIPLSSILDAIDQSSALDDVDPSSSDSDGAPTRPARSPSTSKFPSPPQRQMSSSGAAFGSNFGGPQPKDDEHTFRLVTAKRNYVLCAPSEEDEIKWLAAVKALLNRERGMSSPVAEMPPRLLSPYQPQGSGGQSQGQGGQGGQGQGWSQVPTITQQPPTPGSITGTPGQGAAAQSSAGDGQQAQAPQSIGQRGRSATYLAKSAVADVERRYHPDKPQAAA